jgi:hypothetical protein
MITANVTGIGRVPTGIPGLDTIRNPASWLRPASPTLQGYTAAAANW